MTPESVAWLELAVALSMLGALAVSRLRDVESAARWTLAFSGAALACIAMARAFGSAELLNPLVGRRVLTLEGVSGVVLPAVALLHFLIALTTVRTKAGRFSFGGLLVGDALRLATFACPDPTVLAVLLAVNVLPPYFDLVRRGKSTRVYSIHMTLFVALLAGGLVAESPALLMGAVLVRCGTFPVHVWVTDLIENASFGNALLFVTPLTGMYAAVRLVLPTAPDWVLQGIGAMSLVTAVYAAGMAVVQTDARRFFAFLFLSHSALVLVGMELHTSISLTGALALWVSGVLALGGLGLALRALEGRFGRLALTEYRGLYNHSPLLAVFFLLSGLAAVGFPGTRGFVAAELLVDGAVGVKPLVGLAVAAAAALNGIAVLRAYLLLFTGARHTTGVALGVTPRERVAVLALAALIIGGGLVPQYHIESSSRAAVSLLQNRETTSTAGH
ncbi:MAG TPA: proton-conducting transporter membrane subunit [Gemmataceae bacterium]|nr:proton-conducting transporter membrane subunit [Gemmataceae bacterium]